MLVTMDRYTQYYANQSGGGEIGRVYRASFRVQRDNAIRSFPRGRFRFFFKICYIQELRLLE